MLHALQKAEIVNPASAASRQSTPPKASAQASSEPNRAQKVFDELQQVQWPSRKQAAVDTAVVLAIVFGSSVFLFFLNGLLAEVSKLIF